MILSTVFFIFVFHIYANDFQIRVKDLALFSVIIELHSTILHIYGVTVFRLVNDIRSTYNVFF